tara:strand:- start:252 stop:416 length:165 start_codon:yes stop_codon:yes gene_type:complete
MGVSVASPMNPKLNYRSQLEPSGSGCRHSGTGGTWIEEKRLHSQPFFYAFLILV